MDQAIDLADTLAAAGNEVAGALSKLDYLSEARDHLSEIDRRRATASSARA